MTTRLPILFIHPKAHFPERSSRSVSEKWLRSLNPEVTHKPFTKKEDKALLDTVEKMGGPGNWAELSRRYFPSRNPRSLKYHWIELASDDDLTKRYEDYFKKMSTRGGVIGGVDSDLLSPDDFVVRRKRAKG